MDKIKAKIQQEFEKTFKTELSRDLTVMFEWWWDKIEAVREETIKEVEKIIKHKKIGTTTLLDTQIEALLEEIREKYGNKIR